MIPSMNQRCLPFCPISWSPTWVIPFNQNEDLSHHIYKRSRRMETILYIKIICTKKPNQEIFMGPTKALRRPCRLGTNSSVATTSECNLHGTGAHISAFPPCSPLHILPVKPKFKTSAQISLLSLLKKLAITTNSRVLEWQQGNDQKITWQMQHLMSSASPARVSSSVLVAAI